MAMTEPAILFAPAGLVFLYLFKRKSPKARRGRFVGASYWNSSVNSACQSSMYPCVSSGMREVSVFFGSNP